MTAETLTQEAALFPLRDTYMFDELSHNTAAWGNDSNPNPAYGATFTYHVGQAPAADARLVLTIADDTGKQIRRLNLQGTTGVHRIAWNLRGEPPAAPAGGRGGRGGGAGPEATAARLDPEAKAEGEEEARAEGKEEAQDDTPVFTGRGGAAQGPIAPAGRYRATLGKMTGDAVTAIGEPQTFLVLPLPR